MDWSYLGDGVFIRPNDAGEGFVLFTHHGGEPENEIFLDSGVTERLVSFLTTPRHTDKKS